MATCLLPASVFQLSYRIGYMTAAVALFISGNESGGSSSDSESEAQPSPAQKKLALTSPASVFEDEEIGCPQTHAERLRQQSASAARSSATAIRDMREVFWLHLASSLGAILPGVGMSGVRVASPPLPERRVAALFHLFEDHAAELAQVSQRTTQHHEPNFLPSLGVNVSVILRI